MWVVRDVFRTLSNIWDVTFYENSWELKPLTIIAKRHILDVWQHSEYDFGVNITIFVMVNQIKTKSRSSRDHWLEFSPSSQIYAFDIVTSHLFCRAKQITGFYVKYMYWAAAKPRFMKWRCTAIVATVWHYIFLNYWYYVFYWFQNTWAMNCICWK